MSSTPESLRLGPAHAGHKDFVRSLSAEVFARFGDYETMLPRLMQSPWVWTAVAESGEQPVAFAMYSLEELPHGEVHLTAIAVRPAWQSRGVGRALLRHVEREALRLVPAGVDAAVCLTVAEDNTRARRVFEAAGFRPVPGEAGAYPAGQRSLALRKAIARPGLDSPGPRQELD
jgi:ribosomal protein S18 acetylase RimI-like enzyme